MLIVWVNNRYNNKWETVLLCFYCAHCQRKLQDSVKFQLETFSLFSASASASELFNMKIVFTTVSLGTLTHINSNRFFNT